MEVSNVRFRGVKDYVEKCFRTIEIYQFRIKNTKQMDPVWKSVLGLCEWVEISWTWVVLFSVGPPHGKLFTAITNFKLSTLSKGAKTPSFQKMMKFVKKADSYSCKIFNHESPMSNFFPPHHQPVSPWNLNFPAASRWIIEMETLTPLRIKHRFPAQKMPWLKRVFHIICFLESILNASFLWLFVPFHLSSSYHHFESR